METSNIAENEGSKAIWVFTPSRTDPKHLEFILVQRQKLLQDAVERVRESALTKHKHHLLFVGPRGCGKTHLVTLIVSRLGEDDTLMNRLRIAWLNEDETCTTLLELLIKIHSALEKRYPDEYRADMVGAAYDLKADAALDFVSRHLLASLGSHTLLVVAENLDAIFDGLGDAGQKQLRAFIQENPKISIVATAQRLVEDLSSRTSPFFGFFQTEHLKPLNVTEATELLQNIARLQNKGSLVEFLSTSRGRSRVRALHHLSGGNHRIYIVLSQFITRDSIDALLVPFMKMVDELTPYYQERIRWLPAQQRKIIEYLCTCEGTVPVKEIAKRLFSTPQTISSQLQDLREKGYVEANQRGRESLYEISEPLMRICVEVKENQGHQPLRLLVDFLRVWYDDHELKHRLGKMEPASAGCAYLESAIQRNRAEGNLRRQLFLEQLRMELPSQWDANKCDGFIREFVDKPEGVLLAMEDLREGNKTEAIRCLDESITMELAPSERANLLMFRAYLHTTFDDHRKAHNDFTAIVNLTGSMVDQKAEALVGRGVLHGRSGEHQRAIEDLTAAIRLDGITPENLAIALYNRGITYFHTGEAQREIEDYTNLIGLQDAKIEWVAMALTNRGVAYGKLGERQREMEDYSAVVSHPEVPIAKLAQAHFNRAVVFTEIGDGQRAINDYTSIINLPSVPIEQLASAYLNRGLACEDMGEFQLAIEDYTRVLGLSEAPVRDVAMAYINRGALCGKMGDVQREIEDYTTVIGLKDAPVDQIAMALLNRAITHQLARKVELALSDYTALIALRDVAVEDIAEALINRGFLQGEVGQTQRAIDDYSRVFELSNVPIEQVARALFGRGSKMFQIQRTEDSRVDFETLIDLPDAPINTTVAAYLALSELHLCEGKWHEGFETLENGLKLGAKAQPVYYGSATDLITVIFSAGLNSEGRRAKVNHLLGIYNSYQALPVLGEALVEHLGSVFSNDKPFPSTDNLEGWALAWEQAAKDLPEFRLSIRLLRTGINFVKDGGTDLGILLDLTSTERAILEQAFGLAEKESEEANDLSK